MSLELDLPVAAYDAGDGVQIQRAIQGDGSTRWVVRCALNCLNAIGEWEYEPMPSSRDADFLSRCRYASPHLALSSLTESRKQPNPPIDTANLQSNRNVQEGAEFLYRVKQPNPRAARHE